MITFLTSLVLPLHGVLNINTPVVEDYMYSVEAGEVIRSRNTLDTAVSNGDFLLLYSSENTEKLVNINSTLNGRITYSTELKKGRKFEEGELLFKIRSNEIYGFIKLSKGNTPPLTEGSFLCSGSHDYPLKVIKVNMKTILVSMKLDSKEALQNVQANTEAFNSCDSRNFADLK